MEVSEFDKTFTEIVESLTSDGVNDRETEEVCYWFKKVLEYNVPYGKKTRGMTVVKSFHTFAGSDKVHEKSIHLASVLGWCVELLQAFFLMADDVMDQSITRRGRPCWFRLDGVGLMAVNDAFAIENGVYTILKKYFRNKDCYVHLMELFHETTRQTIFGQCLDGLSSQTGDEIDFTKYTPIRYSAITKYKTSFYSFYLPVALGLHLAGISDEKTHQRIKPILLQMGHLFQVQDDYLDCFGDPDITGKIGTDIEDGKCTWLIVTALEELSEEGKKVLKENYGKSDKTSIARVKELYTELKLPEKYEKYETECYNDILKLIDELEIATGIFYELLKSIYKRKK